MAFLQLFGLLELATSLSKHHGSYDTEKSFLSFLHIFLQVRHEIIPFVTLVTAETRKAVTGLCVFILDSVTREATSSMSNNFPHIPL